MSRVEDLQEQTSALETTLGASSAMIAAFSGELGRMQQSLLFTGREVNALSTSIGGGLRRAFDGLVFDGMKLSDALRGVAQSMISGVYNVAMRPVQGALGDFVANGPRACCALQSRSPASPPRSAARAPRSSQSSGWREI